ncbi:MAG: NapC/NirT family cytochrome c [Planctomycetota bacterium]|nr:NapC/NirT family cytochrome c [Planctomycetota bacterium]
MSSNQPPAEPSPASPSARPFLVLLTSHWISWVGCALILTALSTWLFLLPQQSRGGSDNPYLGLLSWAIVPAVFFAGLALVPVGAWLARRRVQSRLAAVVDKKTAWTRFAVVFGVATLANLAVGTQVTYRAVHHMETPQFCGSCHVMTPEARTHVDSPHSQVTCAECHVGDGASGWVASKVSGTRQFIDNLRDSYHKPIPSGLATDRIIPAKQTCEECHWRTRPGDVNVRVINTFAEDEENSLSQTVLTLHVGGSVLGGIHGRHLDEDLEINFASTDPVRQDIVWVESRNKRTGETKTYTKSGTTPEQVAGLKKITMQCIDCHNRPAHKFQLPGRALDSALAGGSLPTTLPFLKKTAMALLQAGYASQDEAAQKIPAGLLDTYRRDHADVYAQRESEIAAAGAVLATIHNRNVYPELKVTWGTYPDNIGHTDFPGCFRCHDGDHVTAEGKAITNNCFACHFSAALDETAPEILQTLGLEKVLAKARKK